MNLSSFADERHIRQIGKHWSWTSYGYANILACNLNSQTVKPSLAATYSDNKQCYLVACRLTFIWQQRSQRKTKMTPQQSCKAISKELEALLRPANQLPELKIQVESPLSTDSQAKCRQV